MTNNGREQATTLERSLGLGSIVLIGLAYMTPLIVLGTYGVVAQLSNETVPTAYLVTLVAMLFTALSYGRMASLYPVAGSAYTYVGKEMGPQLGFLSGWLIQLDHFFLPMVAWQIGAAYLSAQFPGVPTPVWILAFILITTILNVVGIKTAARQPERDRALRAPPAAVRRLGATRVGRPPRGGRAHRLLPAYEARHPRHSVRGGVAGDRRPAADLPHPGLPPGPAPTEHRRGHGGRTVSRLGPNEGEGRHHGCRQR
jgi:hypothetical protein